MLSEIRGSDDYPMLNAPSAAEFGIALDGIAIVEQLNREHGTPCDAFFPIPDGKHVGFRIRISFLGKFLVGFLVLDIEELTQRGFAAANTRPVKAAASFHPFVVFLAQGDKERDGIAVLRQEV